MTTLPERVAKDIDRFTGRTWLLPKLIEWWGLLKRRLMEGVRQVNIRKYR